MKYLDINEPAEKDPELNRRFGMYWGEFLDDALIDEADWIVVEDSSDGALTVSSPLVDEDGRTTTAHVSGGTPRTYYAVRCTITTDESPPQQWERTAWIYVKQG